MPATLSPIALFVYNRSWHARQTVEALKRNPGAVDSRLFVFADGAKGAQDAPAVAEVRRYLREIDGFAEVTLVEREENLGLAASIIAGVTEIVNRFGSVIVLEDDMVTSPYFLGFMNDSLECYRDDDRVISIHGYIYPVGKPLPETFFLKQTACWGWATWQRGWRLFEPSGERLLKEIRRRRVSYRFDLDGAYCFTRMLQDQVRGVNDSWAIRWQASAFLHDKLTLFPGRSLVRNIGNDGSGVHSAESTSFDVMLAEEPPTVGGIAVAEDVAARSLLSNYFMEIGGNRVLWAARRARAALRRLFSR